MTLPQMLELMVIPEPRSPFADLRTALNGCPSCRDAEAEAGDAVRVDPSRWRRTGIPEVVYAEHKPVLDVVSALRRLCGGQGRALASRVRPQDVAAIAGALDSEFEIQEFPQAHCLIVAQPGAQRLQRGGRVGILSAGSSDVPVALEAALIAEEMGASVYRAWDVGVAGLHRLVEPLEAFAAAEVDVIIVAAGMDGALPSVVSGLVPVPVIGLPTSVGYGFGGGGVGAMTTMLQACAPGLSVVNIDNGIGAGATAALIANRAASRAVGEPVAANHLQDSSLRG
ncbi:MAG: nickel pincer cofactor biosynthesis protein LarB [Thermomicrobiales bacterium]|nr:nickel pincer cofactor biosynthesis protein LarB [Thermomicrobiales bacterium]